MKTIAVIEKGKDGSFGIFTPELEHSIMGEGKSVAEARADFENSVSEMCASYTENGEELPLELRDIEFEYRYDVASVFNYFDFINVTKFSRWAGISAGLMRQYKSCDTYISRERAEQIERALHRAGHEMADIFL